MRILVLTHSFAGNGAAVMLQAVLLHLRRAFNVAVDVQHPGNEPLCAELADAGVRFLDHADPADYDLTLFNTLIDAHRVAEVGAAVPTILWVHEGETLLWNRNLPPGEWALPFQMARRVVFQSAWQVRTVFASFLTGMAPHRIVIIPNGLPPLPEVVFPVQRTPGTVRITFVGGVNPRKRPGDLVLALETLDRPDVEVRLIGSTELLHAIGDEALDAIRTRPDRYHVMGELDRPQVAAWLHGSDIFCLPSGDETQGIAALEAASCGLPPVLSALPAYEGTWTHGQNALLGPAGDLDLLRWHLRALIEDGPLRVRLGAAAAMTAHRHSLDAFLNRFVAMLLEARWP